MQASGILERLDGSETRKSSDAVNLVTYETSCQEDISELEKSINFD